MTTTSRDVARAAGVSVATVSRALSRKGVVAEATRRRVVAEAERLGYSPDPAARRLITGRSGNIGLIVPDLSNPFFADIAKGVHRHARSERRGVFISDTDENPRYEVDAVRHLARQVDGLIWASPRTPDDVIQQMSIPVPTVLLHRRLDGWSSVCADFTDGMRQVVVNLYALGHRTIAYADGPAGSWSGGRRRLGLLKTASEVGLDVLELGHVSPAYEGGLAAADLVLATNATALVAYNDIVAVGALHRLLARGVSVPGDLSVVGCDNTTASHMSSPQLTTVDVPRFEAGDLAVQVLDELLQDPVHELVQHVLGTSLVIRATTVPPGGNRA